MAWKKHWKPGTEGGADAAVVETCPACTSAVSAESDTCSQCGADLGYYRRQQKESGV